MWGVLPLRENMKRMLFLTAWCLCRKVKPWGSKLLLWCCSSNTLKLEPESLWGDRTTTDWKEEQLRKVLEDLPTNTLWNTENMLYPEVRELQRADNSLVLRWQEIQLLVPPPTSVGAKAKQKSKLKATKQTPRVWAIPIDHTRSTQSMWEDTADCESELKMVS